MYYQTPNYSVAHNAKVASSSLSRAVIRDFWPDVESRIQSAAYPAGRGPEQLQAHFLCPHETTPSKPVVLVVRDPLDRFRSAMAQDNFADVEVVLAALEGNAKHPLSRRNTPLRDNEHFKHQHPLAQPSARVFRLADLAAAATHIGLSLPLPVINEAAREKPTLTAAQEARVLAYYAEDKALYDSIPAGGTDYSYSPPAPASVPAPVPASVTATQIRLWLVRNGVSLKQVSSAIAAIPDAKARAEAEVLWEYAPYIERSHPMLAPLGASLGLSESQIDAAFVAASIL